MSARFYTYNNIGNPLSDGTWTYTWEKGRQLRRMSKNDRTVEFKYNENGLRIQKVLNPDTATEEVTNYTLHGKNIVHMTKDNGQQHDDLHFFYDASNKPAIVEFNGTKYAYVHNLQGDIVAILDNAGNKVVEYKYDAWGRIISKMGSLASTLGTVQPFRYRGYVYDEETGLYYLQNRYYCNICSRFICIDYFLGTSMQPLSSNVYVYCNNEPVALSDNSGCVPIRSIAGVDSKQVRSEGGKFFFETTIYFRWDSIVSLPCSPHGIVEKCVDLLFIETQPSSVTLTYSISKDGIISFDNSQPSSGAILDLQIATALVEDMMYQRINVQPRALGGRTVAGMVFELMVHKAGDMVSDRSNFDSTEMGSIYPGSVGYDYNADWFEHPEQHLDEIREQFGI